jgi:hypothetical protein
MLVLLSQAMRRQRQYKSRNDRSPDHFTPPALRIIDTFQDLQKICPASDRDRGRPPPGSLRS